jgi:hypothetical protein
MTIEPEAEKCAHETCVCKVPAGQLYCSPYCAEAAVNPVVGVHAPCRCGHPECEAGRGRMI